MRHLLYYYIIIYYYITLLFQISNWLFTYCIYRQMTPNVIKFCKQRTKNSCDSSICRMRTKVSLSPESQRSSFYDSAAAAQEAARYLVGKSFGKATYIASFLEWIHAYFTFTHTFVRIRYWRHYAMRFRMRQHNYRPSRECTKLRLSLVDIYWTVLLPGCYQIKRRL